MNARGRRVRRSQAHSRPDVIMNGYGANRKVFKPKANQNFDLVSNKLFLSRKQDPDELFNLGLKYQNGLGVKRDYPKAIIYYFIAADQNHVEAQSNLGYMYHQGLGTEKKYCKALYYYKLAAKQNNTAAQYYLGYMYYSGQEVKQDFAKAFYYFKLAVAQNAFGGTILYRIHVLHWRRC